MQDFAQQIHVIVYDIDKKNSRLDHKKKITFKVELAKYSQFSKPNAAQLHLLSSNDVNNLDLSQAI